MGRAKRSLATVKEKAKPEDVDGYGKGLRKLQSLFEKFYLPETEDEYSPHSDSEYDQSEEEYNTMQQAPSPASEYRSRGISSSLAAPESSQQVSKPPAIQITTGRSKCVMTCKKCGQRSTNTNDMMEHRCNPKATPPPRRARSYRPIEPPPQRSYKYPTRCLNMGGVYF